MVQYYLNIDYNMMCDNGVKEMAEMLKTNKSLLSLSVGIILY